MAAEVEEVEEFAPTAVDPRFVITTQGRQHVLYAGLVDCLHQLSSGYFVIDTRLEQLPTAENGQVAVCSARVQVCDPAQPELVRRSATGIGDASPSNVSRLMATATIRMAETRAKARALRDLLNVGVVSVEELEDDAPGLRPPAPPPAPAAAFPPPVAAVAPERIQVGERAYTRPEVLAGYRRRYQAAVAAGIVLPAGSVLDETAPLSALVGASVLLKKAVEAPSTEPIAGASPRP